ncbi:DUF1499 domain-containing protein [Breoghania sp.]|uniref:DUF1499 domain-containing protein n=1 Tax=Breoghania sp. TaxID=2065378 RepID=UPI0029C9E556|nr:DUF1499 domain-containing protein [Breoghania sp.]
MRKRLPIRRAKAANYSRFAGVVSIPVIGIAAALHRGGHLDTVALFSVLGFGFALALSAVVAAIAAIAAIWNRGAPGVGDAVFGLICGLIALTPAAAVTTATILYPRLTDISTDLDSPPRLALSQNRAQPDGHLRPAAQRTAYPDIVPRRFPVGTSQLYAAVEQVIEDKGWTIEAHLAPAMNDDPAVIRVEARTLLLGFVDDVTVRILPDAIGSRLDIRSASRLGEHDLGTNARRIRSLLAGVDRVLTEAYGITEVQESDTAPAESVPLEYEKLDDGPDEPDVPVPGDKPGQLEPAVSG